MHLLIAVRGIKHEVERTINDLQAQYFNFKHRDQKNVVIQMGVRPIQLYELVFPREELATVLTTIKSNNFGFTKKAAWLLRIAAQFFGTKEKYKAIKPGMDLGGQKRIIYMPNCDITPIGYKEDGDMKDDKGVIHERL